MCDGAYWAPEFQVSFLHTSYIDRSNIFPIQPFYNLDISRKIVPSFIYDLCDIDHLDHVDGWDLHDTALAHMGDVCPVGYV